MKQGEWIKARRLELKKTTRELGALIGTTGSAVSNIENHGVIPNLGIAYKLAAALDRPTDWVLTGRFDNNSSKIPIVGNTQAGPDKEWNEIDIGGCYEYVNFPIQSNKYYALKVIGDSMSPRVLEGEVVIVDPVSIPQTGEDVVVKTLDGETMIKTLASIRDNQVFLDSTNSSYKRIIKNKNDLLYMHAVVAVARSVMIRHT
ncbi:helix-turn-helix domain-containing protein [Gilliamella sp. B2969]|uniref:helix-turn-helix domain-containing protein n=1 Tax=Gilliamella sp. B2969 TaxID=2818021 RepID=UPI002269B3CC|nr:XRE family transcriptional regulator [Gilliamella sp. B2969]MCX8731200.1 helix-turn-helix domain-containing protein [Gilliamella sp. B2969]